MAYTVIWLVRSKCHDCSCFILIEFLAGKELIVDVQYFVLFWPQINCSWEHQFFILHHLAGSYPCWWLQICLADASWMIKLPVLAQTWKAEWPQYDVLKSIYNVILVTGNSLSPCMRWNYNIFTLGKVGDSKFNHTIFWAYFQKKMNGSKMEISNGWIGGGLHLREVELE